MHVGCLRSGGIRYEELREASIPVEMFPLRSFKRPLEMARAARALGEYVRRHEIRLVHAFDTPGNLFAVPAARAYRVPAVLSSQRSFRSLAGGLWRDLLRLTDRISDAVVVNCRTLEEHLAVDERVPRGRIRVCYNGIDTGVFYAARAGEERPRRQETGDAELVAGVVCALRPEKGLPTLLRAFARVARPGMRLVVIGSGPLLPSLEALRDELGLGESCVFVPSTREVAPWLRSIDIFVLPSLSEALSNSLMEAMACGCAVIGSRVGGNPELIREGETGLLFRAGDAEDLARALGQLIAEAGMRRKLAEAGAAFIRERFSRERAAEEMGAIYEGFL